MSERDPEIDAALAANTLPCPACKGKPACRPDRDIRGVVMRCLRCGAIVHLRDENASLRDGIFAWNEWVRKARRALDGAKERESG